MRTQKLVHDLSRGFEVEFFIENYNVKELLEELKKLSVNVEYPYEPAKRLLEELERKGISS